MQDQAHIGVDLAAGPDTTGFFMVADESTELKKRTWYYAAPPSYFEIAPCRCGNHKTVWSEYEKHIWCPLCQKDFIPEHNGIFDGPIPIKACALLGIFFDRVIIETGKIERFNPDTNSYTPET